MTISDQTKSAAPGATVHRTSGAAVAALASTTLVAWGVVLFGPDTMHAGPLPYVLAWSAMMTAMMLPSAAPLVLLFRRGASPRATAALATGYLLVWAAAGVPAWLAQNYVPASAAPLALAVAGVYQLTPAKTACLRRCRAPVDFLIEHWGRGPLRIGVEHGIFCLGCCWALMAVLVIAGTMGFAWVVGLAALVALEKLARNGAVWSRASGVAFLMAAIMEGLQWVSGS